MVNQHSGIYQETNGTGALMSHRCLPPTLSKMNAITVQNKCRHRTALFDHKHVAAAARILHVSTRHVHRLMSDGTLPYRKPTPRRALISPDGLLRLVGGPA